MNRGDPDGDAMTRTPDLPRLVELIERDAMIDMYAAAPAGFAAAFGLEVVRAGSAGMLTLRAVPDTFFNRALGLGVEREATEEEVEAIVDHYAAAGVSRWWLQPSPTLKPAHARGWFRARGLVPAQRVWAKFARAPVAPTAVESPLRIAEAGAEQAADFALAASLGFGAPPPFRDWLAALVGRPGWHCYVAYDGDRAVAAGALRMDDGQAWLGIGATVPDARGRGAQSALLSRRIADAVAFGATVIATETGRPFPGEAGPSFANIGRAGFTVIHDRPNLELKR
jgi:hypothetical protein